MTWTMLRYTTTFDSYLKNAIQSSVTLHFEDSAEGINVSKTHLSVQGVLVRDAAITKMKHLFTLNALHYYAKAGGIVIVGIDLLRTTVHLNRPISSAMGLCLERLPASFSARSQYLLNVPESSVLYTLFPASKIESQVFPVELQLQQLDINWTCIRNWIKEIYLALRSREAEVEGRAKKHAEKSKIRLDKAERFKEEIDYCSGKLAFKTFQYNDAISLYKRANEAAHKNSVYRQYGLLAYLKLIEYAPSTRSYAQSRRELMKTFAPSVSLTQMSRLHRERDEVKAIVSPFDEEPAPVSDSDSDSSDFYHEGNDIPCRYHNRNGCMRGSGRFYKHAPDGYTTLHYTTLHYTTLHYAG
ncbi:hypothetical protein BT96DRAFT_942775 [Gymnopus androsaceus JB14]|uniref:C3H1-type domain-containing protein n=1 Tax=Gymnopus androsaceus JB14 TaxID=1447944 RepID=A0A6A4HAX1_9AGAR|nr:hypothetical protein BT96DRAFT_942775 [Gymnopus androsaceus JB14]